MIKTTAFTSDFSTTPLRLLPKSWMGALVSAVVTAFAAMGDAFLYPVLPIYGQEMGFTLWEVGVLLSANRFIRIVGNTPMANLLRKWGTHRLSLCVSVLAVATSLLYGWTTLFGLFLMGRIIWGLCYSGLKMVTLQYTAAVERKQGLAFGTVQALKSSGALLVLWIGPMLIEKVGISISFWIIGGVSGGSIVGAMFLPQKSDVYLSGKVNFQKTFQVNPIHTLVFILAFAIDGVMVVSLAGILWKEGVEQEIVLAAVASFLLLKKICASGVAFLGGVISQWIQGCKVFYVAVFTILSGFSLMVMGYSTIGIIMIFVSNAVVIAFAPMIALEQTKVINEKLQIISSISTWWDIGAATGALVGILLLDIMGFIPLFLTLTTLIFVLFFNFLRANGNANTRTI